jgi:hypothetical protein
MPCACVLLSSVAYLVLPHFLHYLIKGPNSPSPPQKKIIEHKIFVLICIQLLSDIFLISRRTEGDMVKKVYRSSCKVPVILVRF